MRSEIEKWIASGCDYQQGALLYEKYGSNSALKSLFRNPASPFSSGKLQQELKALLKVSTPVSPSYEKPRYQVTDLSPALQEQFKRKGRLYAEASALHADLFLEEDKRKRALLREEIVKRFDEIEFIWKKADQYILTRRKPVTISGLIQQRNNLRSRISKARSKGNGELETTLTEELRNVEKQIAGWTQ